MRPDIGERISRRPPPDTDFHVLCVDPDGDVSERLGSLLAEGRVTAVATPDAAIRRIQDAKPGGDVDEDVDEDGDGDGDEPVDCLVSPYRLPESDGLELLADVRAVAPDLPVILFTADGNEALASEAISAGVTDYVRRDEPDAYDRLVDSITDAVGNVRIRRRLETAEARFRALTENAPFAVVTIDETSTIRYANETVEEIFGYDPDELTGESLTKLMPEDLHDRHLDALDRYLETGERTLDWDWIELPGEREDGRDVPLGITFGEGPHEDGSLFTGIIRDITDRKRREETLERRAIAMEGAMDGMAILDAEGTYLYVNRAHADVYGYDSPEELIGETWHCLYDEEEVDRFETEIFPVVRAEGHWRGEAVGVRTDGTRFPQELSLTALDDGGLVCVVRDITDRKEHERAVEALHAATREMLKAPDRQRVADRAVETARDVLGMSVNGLWFHESDGLVPVAWTDEATDVVGDLPTFPASEKSLSWEVFETGEPRVISDLRNQPRKYNPGTPLRSEIIVPIGEHGVMNVGATEPDVFDESDGMLARLLAENTRAALDRIDQEEELRKRTGRLENQTRFLSEFYVLTTDPDTSFETKLQEMLALCCEHFDFEVGLLTRFSGSTAEILEAHAPMLPLLPGDTIDLPDKGVELLPPPDAAEEGIYHATGAPETGGTGRHGTERGRNRESGGEAAGESGGEAAGESGGEAAGESGGEAAGEETKALGLPETLGFESFLQVPVYVGEERFGLLVFGSPAPRDRQLDSTTVTLAKFVTRWLDHELTRQRTRSDLERQNERLEEFAEVVSHDLRNPLNTAQGYLELIATESDSEHVDALARSLDRMEALVADVLTLARQGQTVEEPEAVELDAIVDRAWSTVAPAADLEVEFEDVTVVADPDRLQRVFENLFRNADEHAGPGVTVQVGLLDDGRGLYLEDDGPGVPEASREAVFDHGHTTGVEGTGFGLSIVRSIVRAHGWEIELTESETGGARFEITGVELP